MQGIPHSTGYALFAVLAVASVLLPPLLMAYSARRWQVPLAHGFVLMFGFAVAAFVAADDLKSLGQISASLWALMVLYCLLAFGVSTWVTFAAVENTQQGKEGEENESEESDERDAKLRTGKAARR